MLINYIFFDIKKKYNLVILDFLTFLWFFEIIHTCLRFYVLIRPTAYGTPFVSKFEWYFFHAIAIDFTWIFLSLVFLFGIASFFPNKYKTITKWILTLQTIIAFLTLVDHETMRYMNWHFSMNFFSTYNSMPGLSQTFNSLLKETPFPFSFSLILIVITLLFFILPKRVKNKIQFKIKNILVFSILFLGICWAYRNVFWKGGFREERLKPVVSLIYEEFTASKHKTTENSFNIEKKIFQKQWLETRGDSLWGFYDSLYPFVRTPAHEFCQNTPSLALCQQDHDKDGYTLQKDCHDWNPSIHPNVKDIPSNGIDEDCDGIDSKPWNVVIFFLESHRAMNAGFLKPYGATVDGTPFLNKLSTNSNSHIWSRFSISGTPTIGALMATHLGIWDHPSKHLSTGFNHLKNRSFVNILREKGYKTNFFSSADPAWDNKIPWLQQWYGRYTYNRNREHDRDMYNHLASWMIDSLSTDEPFLITSISKVNHFPFNIVPGIKPHKSTENYLQRMLKTMVYTENALEDLFKKIKHQPWFDRTVFIFVADHGFFLGERSLGGISGGPYPPLTWIPLLMFGNHPKLNQTHYNFPASQIDIAPTILDLVGITTKAHLAGHSLVRPSTSKNSMIFIQNNHSLEKDSLKIHCNTIAMKNEIYHKINDPLEFTNLWDSTMLNMYQKNCKNLSVINSLILSVYEKNRLWQE